MRRRSVKKKTVRKYISHHDNSKMNEKIKLGDKDLSRFELEVG
jgi:hypothetical protein